MPNPDPKPKPKAKPAGTPKPKAAKPQPPEPKAFQEDDDGPGVYLAKVEEEVEKEEVHYGSLRDKYAKSQKGPAMAMAVRPSNAMIFAGVLLGVAAVALVIIGAWPFVFSARPLSSNEKTTQFVYIAGGILGLFYAAVICWGASKFQSLESYPLAMIGSVLAVPVLVGIWALVILNKKEVKLGFDEVAEAEVV